MTEFECDVLESCLPEIMAWERLHDPTYSGQLTTDQLYDLAKAAGLSEDTCQKLASTRAQQRLDAELPM
jgi:hypothetical protein